MPDLNDCYVLAPERSAALASRFLERFAPSKVASFAREDPSEVLGLPRGATLDDAFRYLEANPAVAYSMYFHGGRHHGPHAAAVLFLSDGSMLLLLSVAHDDGQDVADEVLKELMEFAGSTHGYWAWESPPVESAAEFMRVLRRGTTLG